MARLSGQRVSKTQPIQDVQPNSKAARKPSTSTRHRGRTGCLNCRKRRKKCDEAKPTCSKCTSRGEDCEWDTGFSFKVSSLGAHHPSMKQAEMLNSKLDIRFQPSDFPFSPGDTESPNDTRRSQESSSQVSPYRERGDTSSNNAHLLISEPYTHPNPESQTSYVDRDRIHSHSISPTGPQDFGSHQRDQSNATTAHLRTNYFDGQTLKAQATGTQEKSPTWDANNGGAVNGHQFVSDAMAEDLPELFANDSPSTTYDQLHAKLYNHMVERAKTTALTQPSSPEVMHIDAPDTGQLRSLPESFSKSLETFNEFSWCAKPLKPTKIARRRQLELWRNYLDEIAGWLDMFDFECHFKYEIPLLAKSADHLHYSILALSARQIERKDPDMPYTESLGLYQEAIKLLVCELHTIDTAVIASSVLLCVLEMMSSSPRAWGRHLDGCAMLLEAAGVNGIVGGVRSALFWCFARMDVWGGFLGETLTKIPTSHWLGGHISMHDAFDRFHPKLGGDNYANYAVFLCAMVVNVIYDKPTHGAGDSPGLDWEQSKLARWKALFDLLEDWHRKRPEVIQPLMSYPPDNDDPHSFPMVLYNASPAANGNQLYHAASILMLQEKPKGIELPKSTKSILWHARQICGIAVSNFHHGAWINALQPLWIAGKVMSHRSEHQAILEILARLERDTGWATAWRAQDLMDYWGDVDD